MTEGRLVRLATAAGVALGVVGALVDPRGGAAAAEPSPPRSEARDASRPRLMRLAGATAVAIAAVFVAVVVSSSPGGGTASPLPSTLPAQGAAPWNALLAGVPQRGNTLGAPSAPVTLQYYGDLECPVCQAFQLQTFPRLVTDLVKTGKVKVVYRGLQTATRDADTFLAQQVAVLAAGRQDKAWYYIDTFYREQGREGTNYVNASYLHGLAGQVPGLNVASWQAALHDASLADQVRRDAGIAAALGFNSTPTLVAIGPGGRRGIVGLVGYGTVLALVQSVSCGPTSPCVTSGTGIHVSAVVRPQTARD